MLLLLSKETHHQVAGEVLQLRCDRVPWVCFLAVFDAKGCSVAVIWLAPLDKL